jgi:hypothetical protein
MRDDLQDAVYGRVKAWREMAAKSPMRLTTCFGTPCWIESPILKMV